MFYLLIINEIFLKGKLNDSNKVVNDGETNGSAPDFSEFVENLRTKIEVFVNRIRNDQARGRSIVSDSGIQAMFVNLTSLHTQLIKNMSDLDDRRGKFFCPAQFETCNFCLKFFHRLF